MKSEKQMRMEGRTINRAIDNYEPLRNTSGEAKPGNQETLQQADNLEELEEVFKTE